MATDSEAEILRNIAFAMEQERETRRMTKLELAQLCELSEVDYQMILDGSANLRLKAIDRISNRLGIPFAKLFAPPSPYPVQH